MKHTLTLILTLFIGRSAFAETYLVENGQPSAEIVIADKPARMTKLAAKELQSYVAKMSGARLPIVTDRHADKAAIFVGRSRHTDALGLATDALGLATDALKHGAFRMASGENWLALLGADKDFVPIEPWGRKRDKGEAARVNAAWDKITGDTFWNSALYPPASTSPGTTAPMRGPSRRDARCITPSRSAVICAS